MPKIVVLVSGYRDAWVERKFEEMGIECCTKPLNLAQLAKIINQTFRLAE